MTPCQLSILGIGLVAVGALAFALYTRLERKRFVREMGRMAFHDPLTSLPNRLLFMDRASIAFANAKRSDTLVAVVFIDLDRFKLINDSFGHDVGDEVLRGVARRLREQVREVDTVARLGGDEFTLLMPGIHQPSDIAKISSKLVEAFHQALLAGGREVQITVSVGTSLFPDNGKDAETLVRCADTAMYRAKQRGGDAFELYSESLDAHAREELELETRLRRALLRKEFVLYYQPRIDSTNNRVVAFEALLRWKDPDRGLILPNQFIHAAEVSGIIVPIGEWVLQAACRQAAQWHADGCRDLVVSVNLSPRQFHRLDLFRAIEQALEASGLPPQFLELEVDESCVMNNADASMSILVELKSLGVRVLISHFGAGYSSLSYLRRFPIDGLKLDRSFLSDDDVGHPLATAALVMAKALRLKVIGEGVETEEAAAFLRSQSCDDIQGYLVSAPVPAQDCDKLIHATVRT